MSGKGLLKERTRQFALDIIRFAGTLTPCAASRTLGNQILRSGTSIGANYRAACRARSNAEFIAKLGIVEEEADETLYWLDLIEASEIGKSYRIDRLKKECDEILAMTVASIKRIKSRRTYEKHRKEQ